MLLPDLQIITSSTNLRSFSPWWSLTVTQLNYIRDVCARVTAFLQACVIWLIVQTVSARYRSSNKFIHWARYTRKWAFKMQIVNKRENLLKPSWSGKTFRRMCNCGSRSRSILNLMMICVACIYISRKKVWSSVKGEEKLQPPTERRR